MGRRSENRSSISSAQVFVVWESEVVCVFLCVRYGAEREDIAKRHVEVRGGRISSSMHRPFCS